MCVCVCVCVHILIHSLYICMHKYILILSLDYLLETEVGTHFI